MFPLSLHKLRILLSLACALVSVASANGSSALGDCVLQLGSGTQQATKTGSNCQWDCLTNLQCKGLRFNGKHYSVEQLQYWNCDNKWTQRSPGLCVLLSKGKVVDTQEQGCTECMEQCVGWKQCDSVVFNFVKVAKGDQASYCKPSPKKVPAPSPELSPKKSPCPSPSPKPSPKKVPAPSPKLSPKKSPSSSPCPSPKTSPKKVQPSPSPVAKRSPTPSYSVRRSGCHDGNNDEPQGTCTMRSTKGSVINSSKCTCSGCAWQCLTNEQCGSIEWGNSYKKTRAELPFSTCPAVPRPFSDKCTGLCSLQDSRKNLIDTQMMYCWTCVEQCETWGKCKYMVFNTQSVPKDQLAGYCEKYYPGSAKPNFGRKLA